MTRSVLLTIALGFSLAATACSDDAAPAGKPACDELAETCHPFDTGSGPIHECHEYAEDPSHTDAQCEAMHTSCFALCTDLADAATDAQSAP
ncbi:MAG: hypothetical protein IPK60_10810 [Sandaracinaceae bacterium]|jgi:hypothetical protein|nr:hypothetical protein [Sandaracinaceae bacterium]